LANIARALRTRKRDIVDDFIVIEGKAYVKWVFVFILVTASFPLWLHLDQMPVRVWDEAKNSVHAVEMFGSGEWRYRAINGAPDETGIKPPLLIWLQSLGLHMFGLNEIGLRWPSAAAAFGLCLFIVVFLYKRGHAIAAGMAPLILVSMPGFLGPHMARTGDHDSLMIFFTIAGVLCFYEFCKSNSTRSIVWTSGFFTLAVLTKSIAPLMLLPGMLIFSLFMKQGKALFSHKGFWFSLLGSIGLIAAVYLLRESRDPGYLERVWNDELFPRYFNYSENYDYEKESFWYYFKAFPQRLGFWFWLLLPAVILNLSIWRKDCFSLQHYLIYTLLLFLMVISYGTKNFWYDGPALPLFAILIALATERSLNLLPLWKSIWPRRMIIMLGLLLILEHPYRASIDRVIGEKEHWWDREIYGVSYQLRELLQQEKLANQYKVLYPDPVGYIPWLFYQKAIHQKHPDTTIEHVKREEIQTGDWVVCSQKEEINWLHEHFQCDLKSETNSGQLYKVISKK
jgi:4-amino-4-deoxy-L-arabinose transferase-like glycosyltransferase